MRHYFVLFKIIASMMNVIAEGSAMQEGRLAKDLICTTFCTCSASVICIKLSPGDCLLSSPRIIVSNWCKGTQVALSSSYVDPGISALVFMKIFRKTWGFGLPYRTLSKMQLLCVSKP